MTSDRITVITTVISQTVAAHRKREGLTRAEFAAACQAAGAPASFTATVVGHLESGRLSGGGRRREVAVDELVFIAKAMGTTPLGVLGEQAAAFGGDQVPPCPRCTAEGGVMVRTLTEDLADLGDLGDLEPTLAATARVLAEAIDAGADGGRLLPRLTKELRATLEQIAASRRGVDSVDGDDDDDFGDLDAPE